MLKLASSVTFEFFKRGVASKKRIGALSLKCFVNAGRYIDFLSSCGLRSIRSNFGHKSSKLLDYYWFNKRYVRTMRSRQFWILKW